MAEYIEREETCGACIHADICKDVVGSWFSRKNIAYCKTFKPAADVAPVVHGRWIDYHFVRVDCPKDGFPTVKCSKCEIAFCDLINNHHFMYHYCPNCGARMDGE